MPGLIDPSTRSKQGWVEEVERLYEIAVVLLPVAKQYIEAVTLADADLRDPNIKIVVNAIEALEEGARLVVPEIPEDEGK